MSTFFTRCIYQGSSLRNVSSFLGFKNPKPNPPPIVFEEVRIGDRFTTRYKDKLKAKKLAEKYPYINEIDWHHSEEGVMQAVDREVHKRFTHIGGFKFFSKG